ncbi:hypothetical protein AMTR_s00155p00067650 [Amborella trichopoda]|uniref:Uncharacterized protein n=1 Tax=Amborella trichopoda TaxID=13333 RepID=W1PJ74_AMBTC|nr:hypothetical protein AMTR_s00155p00067650 [Amborella trichopoda]
MRLSVSIHGYLPRQEQEEEGTKRWNTWVARWLLATGQQPLAPHTMTGEYTRKSQPRLVRLRLLYTTSPLPSLSPYQKPGADSSSGHFRLRPPSSPTKPVCRFTPPSVAYNELGRVPYAYDSTRCPYPWRSEPLETTYIYIYIYNVFLERNQVGLEFGIGFRLPPATLDISQIAED